MVLAFRGPPERCLIYPQPNRKKEHNGVVGGAYIRVPHPIFLFRFANVLDQLGNVCGHQLLVGMGNHSCIMPLTGESTNFRFPHVMYPVVSRSY